MYLQDAESPLQDFGEARRAALHSRESLKGPGSKYSRCRTIRVAARNHITSYRQHRLTRRRPYPYATTVTHAYPAARPARRAYRTRQSSLSISIGVKSRLAIQVGRLRRRIALSQRLSDK